ncbi:Monocarboxylate transporter 12-B [Chionoecetes opilio]|uniref:Monocarboxylate transporter 12-B n=1 Tax=Chionoecetes opilio TaxID=41210 RepID=A0A8J4YA33_CHIOP|nr:Monocarboxylate transporter 12-B [Chionoecetes opilio]
MTRNVKVSMAAEDDEKRCQSEVSSHEEIELEQRRLSVEEGRENDVPAGHEATRGGNKAEDDVGGGQMEAPDGGWGWVAAFGSAVIMMLIPVMGPCFGILFSQYLLREGTTSTLNSWIFGIQTFLWNVTSLLVRPLSQEFGWRAVGVIGAFMASLGFTITSFTPSPEFLFFSYSVLGGIGGGMVSCLCFIVVPSYFTRRRGRAHAIMMGGVSTGQIAVPPLTRFLQDTFGDRGATLVFSGLMLHACVAAATFHPVEWHMKARPVKDSQHEKDEASPPISPQANTPTKSSKSLLFVRVAKSTLSDLGILRSRRACIVCVSNALACVNLLYFLMMVPFAMQDAGFSPDVSAWSISAVAVASFFTRLFCSVLSDRSFFSVRAGCVAGCGIMAVSTAIFPLLKSTGWLMANMGLYGIGYGAYISLYSLVIIDVMGLQRLAPMFGTSAFINGITLVIMGPPIGMIRDATQSYAISIWVLAGISVCATLMWTLMGEAIKYDKQRGEEGRPDL